MTLTIADYSEFQGVVRPNGQQVVIIRAHNGWRPDIDFVANRAAAHAAGCAAVGLYQYLLAGLDVGAQANELCDLVGTLAPNEWLICDLEEGQGDEQSRWQAWEDIVAGRFDRRPGWLYSGEAFAAAHNLHPDWEAAYGSVEPPQPHKLWQDTDVYPWPWGRADASVFDGNLAEFLVAAGITTTPPVPAGPNPPEVEVLLVRDPVSGACYLTNGVNKTYIGTPADLSALQGRLGQPVELSAGLIEALAGAGPT